MVFILVVELKEGDRLDCLWKTLELIVALDLFLRDQLEDVWSLLVHRKSKTFAQA